MTSPQTPMTGREMRMEESSSRDHAPTTDAAMASASHSTTGQGWMPFSTAPRDGTPFLTFTPDNTFSAITGIEVMWFDSQLGLVYGPDCSEPVFTPTDWMPLPRPPVSPEPDDQRLGEAKHAAQVDGERSREDHNPTTQDLDVKGLVERLWQDLLDKDDRTSPEEYPDMVLVSYEEFAGYLLQSHTAQQARIGELEKERTAADQLRRAVAELRGQDPETWPSHGNWSLAITSVVAVLQSRIGELEKACRAAEQFIANGVELGFIRMPDPETPDSAHETLPMIRQTLKASSHG